MGLNPVNFSVNLTRSLPCERTSLRTVIALRAGRSLTRPESTAEEFIRLYDWQSIVLSSWIRLLSDLLMQIRCFDYRKDPVRVQS